MLIRPHRRRSGVYIFSPFATLLTDRKYLRLTLYTGVSSRLLVGNDAVCSKHRIVAILLARLVSKLKSNPFYTIYAWMLVKL